MASREHRRSTRTLLIATAAVIVAAGAGASAWALTGGSAADYRTAAATIGSVQETIQSTGTLAPVDTAQLSFQVAGQVASVDVQVGQHVTQGQVLAALGTSAFTSDVDDEQSAITAAQTKLTSDEAAEASATAASTTTTAPGGSGSSGAGKISADQATLTSDQHRTDTDSAKAAAELASADTLCGGSTGSGSTGSGSGSPDTAVGAGSGTGGSGGAGAGSGSGTSPGSGSSASGAGTSGGGGSSSSTSCTGALQLALSDQQTVSRDEETVSKDESALAKGLGGSQTASGQSGTGLSGSSSSSTAVSPDQVAADQASLDADEVQMSEAQTSLDEAQLTSPIAGEVASVGITAGQSVSADSSSDQIVVIGPQDFDVSTTVAVADVSEIKVGQQAVVTLDGQGGQLAGTVTEVGPPPVSSTTTDYPVVVSLPAGTQGLYDGAAVSVSIVVDRVSGVVTVPTSAVHELGRLSYVSELVDGTLKEAPVTVGATGDTLTEVTSGVKAGTTVVLANLAEPVPSNTTTGPASFAGVGSLTGAGGFGGGGFRQRLGGGATAAG